MDKIPELLKGQHIVLRKLDVKDAEITHRWRHSQRANLLNQSHTTIETQAGWIASRPLSEINYIIETKDGTPVGMLSLVAIDTANARAESARFLIGEEEKVKGIPAAVEAMQLLYELAFKTLSLHKVYGTVAAENHLMIKWQKYLGMKEEGRLREHYFINEHFQDAVCLGILKSEYETTTKSRMKALVKMASFPA